MSTSLPRGQTKAKILPLFRLSFRDGLRLSRGLPGGSRGLRYGHQLLCGCGVLTLGRELQVLFKLGNRVGHCCRRLHVDEAKLIVAIRAFGILFDRPLEGIDGFLILSSPRELACPGRCGAEVVELIGLVCLARFQRASV